jgi:uncharacterized protein YkvS
METVRAVKEWMEELKSTVESLQQEIVQLKATIEDNHKELRVRELSLERTTTAKDGFMRENNWLTAKL